MSRLQSICIAFDQLLNALTGGWADETLSSRAHRLRLSGSPFLADAIDGVAGWLGDDDHCRESYESERVGRQLPPELRGK